MAVTWRGPSLKAITAGATLAVDGGIFVQPYIVEDVVAHRNIHLSITVKVADDVVLCYWDLGCS